MVSDEILLGIAWTNIRWVLVINDLLLCCVLFYAPHFKKTHARIGFHKLVRPNGKISYTELKMVFSGVEGYAVVEPHVFKHGVYDKFRLAISDKSQDAH